MSYRTIVHNGQALTPEMFTKINPRSSKEGHEVNVYMQDGTVLTQKFQTKEKAFSHADRLKEFKWGKNK